MNTFGPPEAIPWLFSFCSTALRLVSPLTAPRPAGGRDSQLTQGTSVAVQVASQLVAAYAELRQLPVVVQSLLDQLLQGAHPQAAAAVQDARLLRDLRVVR